MTEKKRGRLVQLIGGLLMIFLGIIVLIRGSIDQEIVEFITDILWPIIIAIIGFILLIRTKRVFLGGITLILGIINLLAALKIIDLNLPNLLFGIILAYVGLVLLVKFFKPREKEELTDVFWKIIDEDERN